MPQKEKREIKEERGGKRNGKWKSRGDEGRERREGENVTEGIYIYCFNPPGFQSIIRGLLQCSDLLRHVLGLHLIARNSETQQKGGI